MGAYIPDVSPSAADKMSAPEEIIVQLSRSMLDQIRAIQASRAVAWRTTFDGEKLVAEPIYADQLYLP